MSAPTKAAFSPVPPRAAGDKRLTASHYSVLIAIASHDRMSKCQAGRQGCWAGNKTLAQEANVNYTNLSTLIGELIAWGYISRVPRSTTIDELAKLEPATAQQIFCSIAGASAECDPYLAQLLSILDGHALSISLVAAQARGLGSLKGIREDWETEHAKLLRNPNVPEGRLTSVLASLALSLNSQKMTSNPIANRLLSLLAYVPGGLPEDSARDLLGDKGSMNKDKANAAVTCLQQLKLLDRLPDRRLRMLTPLRECVKESVPLLPADKIRLIKHYLSLAKKSFKIGTKDWPQWKAIVDPEADNLDPICELAVEQDANNPLLDDALAGIGDFHKMSGLASVRSLHRAIERFSVQDLRAARCLEILGCIYMDQHRDHPKARQYLQDALLRFRRLKKPAHEAQVLFSLGNLAYHSEDLEAAKSYFKQSLVLNSRSENYLEANALAALARVKITEADYETARVDLERAQTIFIRIGDRLGEGNCVRQLANISARFGDTQSARQALLQQIPIDRDLDSAANIGNTFAGLARLAMNNSNFPEARSYVEKALISSRKLGGEYGEATGLIVLANISVCEEDLSKAESLCNRAMSLFHEATRHISSPLI